MCCMTKENQLFLSSRLWKPLHVLVNSMRGNQRSNAASDCRHAKHVWVTGSKSRENTVISKDGNILEELQNKSPCFAARATFSATKLPCFILNCRMELLVDILRKSLRLPCMYWELGLFVCVLLCHMWLWRSIDTKDKLYCTVFDFSVFKNSNISIYQQHRGLNVKDEKDSAKIPFIPSNWPLGSDGWTIRHTNSSTKVWFSQAVFTSQYLARSQVCLRRNSRFKKSDTPVSNFLFLEFFFRQDAMRWPHSVLSDKVAGNIAMDDKACIRFGRLQPYGSLQNQNTSLTKVNYGQ